jgi:hypothetical protein
VADVAVAVGVLVGRGVGVLVAGTDVFTVSAPADAFQLYSVPQAGEKMPSASVYVPVAAVVGTCQAVLKVRV